MSTQRAASRNAVCKVPGCGAPIPEDNTVGKKCRVCGFHMKTPCFELEGQNVRFCSLCRRFEAIELFDGEKKSCRASLEKHNLRRRKHKPAMVLDDEPSNSGGGGAIPGSPAAHDAAGMSSADTPSLSAAAAPVGGGTLLGGPLPAAGWAGWDESRLVFQGKPWMASPFLDQRGDFSGGQVSQEGRRGGSVDSRPASSLVSAGSGGQSTGSAPPQYQQYQAASPPQQQQQQQQAGDAAFAWRIPLVQTVPVAEGATGVQQLRGGLGAPAAAGGTLLPSPHAIAAAAAPQPPADGGGEAAQPDMNALDTLSAMLMSLDLQEQPMPTAMSSFRLGDLSMVMGSAELDSFRSWLPTFVGDSMPLDNVPLDSLPREFWEQHKDELAQMLRPGASLPYSQPPADAVPQQAQRQAQQRAEQEAQQQAQRQAAWVAQALAALQQPPGAGNPPPGPNLAVLALQQQQQQQQQEWQGGERQAQEWEPWQQWRQPSPQWQQSHPQPQQAAQQRCRPPASEVAGLLGGHGLPTPEQLQQALQQQQQQLLQELQQPVTSQGSQGSGGRPTELQNRGYASPQSSLFM